IVMPYPPEGTEVAAAPEARNGKIRLSFWRLCMGAETDKVTAHVPISVAWAGGSEVDAGRECGPRIHIDSDAIHGPSRVDVLLAAIATCAATDVVTILQKQRTPPKSLEVRVESTRVTSIPRRLASVLLRFTIAGDGIGIEKANRAIELSVEKYCSVR